MRNFPNYSIKRPARLVKPRESGTSVSLFGSLPRLHRSRVCLHPLSHPPHPPILFLHLLPLTDSVKHKTGSSLAGWETKKMFS